jgi:N4-(beta-N-acetylglucosaminyl)-L-asparaginase
VVELMRQGRSPEEACREAVERVYKKQQKRAKDIQVGFIAINKNGQFGSYCLQKGFSYAVHSNSGNRLIEADSKIK